MHAEIERHFREYLCEAEPMFEIAATARDMEHERGIQKRLDEKIEDLPPFPEAYLEDLAIFREIADRMPSYDTVLFHGSVVAAEGRAYLFAAPSGTGKTTHTRLWLQQNPEAYVLNGDKPFLRVTPENRVLAGGGPWRGKEKLGRNEILPLEAICLLERARENHIRTITPGEAIQTLIERTHRPKDAVQWVKTLQILDRISRNVRLYRLACNMDPEAARVSMDAMLYRKPGERHDGTNDL